MLFVLLYSPCFVALVVIKNEAGGWRWLVFSMVFNTALAYAVSAVAFNIAAPFGGDGLPPRAFGAAAGS